ncbi:MAG: 50S ribosomal protein L32 [Patescibacteria group bacterium]|nr:50S ribosomal protein L32 [Patescibacteria group bacterium]
MPQEPKRRHSRQRKGKRRSSIKLSVAQGITCSNCGGTVLPHVVCKNCGYYNGKQIIVKKEKKKSKEKEKENDTSR